MLTRIQRTSRVEEIFLINVSFNIVGTKFIHEDPLTLYAHPRRVSGTTLTQGT